MYVKETKFLVFHVGLEFSDQITSFKFNSKKDHIVIVAHIFCKRQRAKLIK